MFQSLGYNNRKFHLENRLVNFFSNYFSFHKANHSLEESKSHYCSHFDNIVLNILSDPFIVIIVSDISIKNNVAMSIAYVHLFNNSLIKTLHYTINVMITEVELFAIKCRINQATQISGTSYIIIITNVLHTA